jgi:putative ABC transport system permease protein
MLSNYLKVATRNIRRQKLYAFINALGLSIGIAFCLLIYLYIEDERSFDQFHANKNRIYRIQEKSFDTWQPKPEKPYQESAWLQTGLAPALKADLAEVEYACRFNPDADGVVRYQDKAFTESISYTDPDFFRMFTFPLLTGNPEKLFQNKSDVVITPAIAEKYFGKEDPMGKTLTIDVEGEKSFIVAGIIEAPPAHSSLDFKILVPCGESSLL